MCYVLYSQQIELATDANKSSYFDVFPLNHSFHQ